MKCGLCPHNCDIAVGGTGFCRARSCRDGKIICENYGKVTSLALDPIEKKPLARFMPGSMILSAGSYGCNLACPFCQNWEISAAGSGAGYEYISPEKLVGYARQTVPQGNIGLAFTYNEPLIGYEYVRDCADLAKQSGLAVVLVTNGYINEAPLSELLPLTDAMNIDLKGFTEDFYRSLGGRLATVEKSIVLAARRCHVELTTLVIPGLNDSEKEMDSEAAWIASLDPELPLHISRFFPRYKMNDRPTTPVKTVYRLREVALAHLKHVYTGNC